MALYELGSNLGSESRAYTQEATYQHAGLTLGTPVPAGLLLFQVCGVAGFSKATHLAGSLISALISHLCEHVM